MTQPKEKVNQVYYKTKYFHFYGSLAQRFRLFLIVKLIRNLPVVANVEVFKLSSDVGCYVKSLDGIYRNIRMTRTDKVRHTIVNRNI